jgi:hypothetical protein
MKRVFMTVRFILTIGLLFSVHREAGPWTALTLFLLAIGIECHSVALEIMQNKVELKEIQSAVRREASR